VIRVARSRRPRRATPLITIAVVVAFACLPAVVGAGLTSKLVDAFILVTMATMWNLLAGYAGLVSVGQQTFIGLGSYIVLILAQWGLQPYLALPLAAVGCAILALPASWLLFRLRGGYFAIATWVLADAVQLVVSHFPSLGGGTGANLPAIAGLGPATRLAWTYWSALAIAVAALGLTYLLLRGRLGLVLTAVRDDEIGARSVGARVGWAKRIVFLVAAAGCGAAGGLLILSQLNVLATNVFSVGWSAKMIFITIIGGIGSIEGPIVGTAVYVALQELLASFGAWYFIVVGSVAIVVALWAPRGLWGFVTERVNLRPFPIGYWLRVDDPEDGVRGAHSTEEGAG
jgi:ABC-type branched-subunit amino acid transport system permease subunit